MAIFCMLLELSLKAPHIKSATTTSTLKLHIYRYSYVHVYDGHKIMLEEPSECVGFSFPPSTHQQPPIYRNFSHKVLAASLPLLQQVFKFYWRLCGCGFGCMASAIYIHILWSYIYLHSYLDGIALPSFVHFL